MSSAKTATPTPLRVGWREFVSGAAKPSLPALIGGLFVAGALLLACVALLTPGLLASVDCGYFMINADDDYAYLTARVLQVSRSESTEPAIALIGASASREVVGEGNELAALLTERLEQPVAVHQLSGAGLTHWEAAQIADCVADSFRGVVVLEVSPVKLAFPPWRLEELVRTPRLALDSPVLDEEIRLAGLKVPRRHGNFFLDHYGFFSARPTALLNLVRGPVEPDFHQARTWRTLSEPEWEGALEWLWLRMERYPENGEKNFEALGRTVARLRESGRIHVVLLESVRNPRAEGLLRDSPRTQQVLEQYEAHVAAFARAWDVPYWNIAAEAGLAPEDFIDTSHVRNSEAARRYIETLALRLAGLLETANTEEGTE